MEEFTDEYLDRLLGFTGDYRVDAGKASPHAGIRFPEGSKKIVFEIWVEMDGNVTATREAIKRRKLLGGRVPSMAAIRQWAANDQWEVLKTMYNDGLRDFLEASKDPSIRDAIKSDATFFEILLKMRSSLIAEMIKPKSKLWPNKPNDALALVRQLELMVDTYRQRAARSVSAGNGGPEANGGEVDNVLDYLKEVEKRRGGETPLTSSDLAMDILKSSRN